MEVVGVLFPPHRPRSSLPSIAGSIAEEGRYSSHVLDVGVSLASGEVDLSRGDGQEAVLAFGFFDEFVSDVNDTTPTIEDG